MINGGSMSLNKNDFNNNLYFINNQSYLNRNGSPLMKMNTTPYQYSINNNNYINNAYHNTNLNNKRNIKNMRYPSYKSYFNESNNYYLPSSQQYINANNNYNYKNNQDVPENNEEKLIMKKLQNIINENEKKKEQQILNDFYTQNYKEMVNKNIDSYPNGINLSISNCETQYPITKLNKNEDFVRKLRIFLDDYEKNNRSKNQKTNKNNKNNNNSNSLTSYEFYSKKLKNSNEKKSSFKQKIKYMNDSNGEMSNTFREPQIDNNQNYTKKNNSILKFIKDYNKTCDNFRNKRNKNSSIKETTNKKRSNYDTNVSENYTIRSIGEVHEKNNGNLSKSRIKLMSIQNKQKEYRSICNRFTNIKNRKNEIIGKNLSKEYELQEKYISKIKLFIDYIEGFYIMSLNKFFRYFIKILQTYNLLNATKNKDCAKLLKRFQKTRNLKNNLNNISNNSNINNTISHKNFILSQKNIIENYKTKYNSKPIKNNISPEIYIPKNKIEHIRLSRNNVLNNNVFNNLSNNKRKNMVVSSTISNDKNIKTTDNKYNLSTDYKSKKIFSSQEKKNMIKQNISKNNYLLNNKEVENKNNHIKNISSFDINSKTNTFDDFTNNLLDKNNSKPKPIIYLKPKSRAQNLKKMIISKDKNLDNKINTEKKISYNKEVMFNNTTLNNELNNITNQSLSKQNITFQNKNSFRSPIKSKSPSKIDTYKKVYSIKTNEGKRLNKQMLSKNIAEELVIKNLNTHDKRLWVSIKYITSELSVQKFSKMKIRRRLLNLSNNKNIFLNNELQLLNPFKIDTIEIIPPLSLFKKQNKSNNKITMIPEEKEDMNYSSKILDMIKIIQKYIKKNIIDSQKKFFEALKEKYNLCLISLSQRKTFSMIKNNFKSININNISYNNLEDNDNEIEENITNSKKSNKKKEHWKRNLFPEVNIPRLKTEDNDFNFEKINNLNRSELYEKSEFSDTVNTGEKSLNISGVFDRPKKHSFRLKITKYKIFREIIGQKKKIKIKKDIIKEEEEMRKKNKIIYLLTNKFSDYNNCLRKIKNYFNIWKVNILNIKSTIFNKNDNEKNEKGLDNTNGIKDNENNINYSGDDKIKEKKEEDECEKEEDDDYSNIDNLDSKDEGIIKINDLINNRSDILNNFPLNELSKINNQKRIEINSIKDSEENKSFLYDRNELEEKIQYFRIYLINYYAFKKKNIGSSEEEKEE